MQTLVSDLRSFKLSGMAFSLEERLIYAQTNKLSYREFLELLCDDEKSNRKDNNYSSFDKKYQKHAIILKQTKSIKTENGKIYKRNTEKFFPIIMMPV